MTAGPPDRQLDGDGVGDIAGIWSDGTAHVYPGDKDKWLAGALPRMPRNTRAPQADSYAKQAERSAKDAATSAKTPETPSRRPRTP